MNRSRSIPTTIVGVLLTAVMLFPLYWMVNVSLTQPENLRKDPPDLLPLDPNVDGYVAVVQQQGPYLLTSLAIGIGTVLLTVALSAPAAFALAKLRPRGASTVSFVLLIAQMIPSIIMAMGFYLIFNSWGILDTIPGLILADSTLAVPFGVLIFTAFMSASPMS